VAGVFASVSLVMISAENNQKLLLTNEGSGGWEYRQSMFSLYSHNNQNCSSFHLNNLQLSCKLRSTLTVSSKHIQEKSRKE
jgi:hypothetical protein